MGLLGRVRETIRRFTVLPALCILARLHYRRGDLGSALSRCNGAIAIDPNSFGAHVLRGRIFLRQKDFLKARREFLLAQDLDARRFRRVLDSLQRASGGININLFYFSSAPVKEGAGNDDFLEDFLSNDDWCEARDEGLRFGDFMHYEEYRKFRSMPAITEEEIESTDWDQVLADLFESEK
jgi:tetratricopeptide (TPR) repeat protein